MREPVPLPARHVIERLGVAGDGLATTPAGPLHVPFALPGEQVTIGADGTLAIDRASPERRRTPLCPHFPTCGGCAVQHMGDRLYGAWKLGLLEGALRQHGITAAILEMISAPPASRRRAILAATREGTEAKDHGVRVGFNRAGTITVEPVGACAILHPAILGALEAIERLAGSILPARSRARIGVLAARGGLDVAFLDVKGASSAETRRAAVRQADTAPILRLTVNGDIWMQKAAPELHPGGVMLVPPPGAFVQPVEDTEAQMIRLVEAAVSGARRVADLFAGVGTFALPLARGARVTAVDSDRQALAALGDAHRRAQGLKPVTTLVRDLMREPLSPLELGGLDAVVLDPPRAGARSQVEAIGRSKVARVVSISCNPGSFARDAASLAGYGFRLGPITPIDQFLFTPHLEMVATLTR